jgi:hypothetical protein
MITMVYSIGKILLKAPAPTNYDTDGDGVNDKDDAFPTDPNRTEGDIAIPLDPGPQGEVLGIEDITENDSTNELALASSNELEEDGTVLGRRNKYRRSLRRIHNRHGCPRTHRDVQHR